MGLLKKSCKTLAFISKISNIQGGMETLNKSGTNSHTSAMIGLFFYEGEIQIVIFFCYIGIFFTKWLQPISSFCVLYNLYSVGFQ